jgi:hypothetical protein
MLRNAVTPEVWELFPYPESPVTVTYANSANPLNEWVHHAFVRSSGTLVWYINGVAKQTIASYTYDFSEVDFVDVGNYGAGVWPGWISNFRVIKGDAIYTSNFTVPTGPLSVTANTVLLLNAGNSFKNRGSLTTTVETLGSILPQVSAFNPFGQESEYAVGENKGSTVFSSTSDYLECGSDVSFAFGTGDYTVEFWYYSNPTNGGTIWGTVFDTTTAAAYIGGLFITASPTDGQTLIVYHNGGTRASGTTSGKNLEPGEWTHCAVTRSGSNINIWINGVLDGTGASGGDDLTLDEATVGRATYWGTAYSLQGGDIVSDLRVTKGTALYTSAFTPPTAPVGNTNASLYLPMDNVGIYDKTGNHTLELSGDTSTSTTYTKYSNTSAFTDTGGILIKQVPSFGSIDFTIEGWFYPTEVPGTGNAFIGHAWGGYGSFLFYSSNTQYSLYMSGSGSGWDIVSGENVNVTPWTGSWKHFAFTRSGNVLRVFLDGTQTYTKTISGSLMAVTEGTNDILSIGSAINGTSGVHGAMYVENFQVLKGVAKYTANFTPPTEEQGRAYQAES